jgi:hypothetical protein
MSRTAILLALLASACGRIGFADRQPDAAVIADAGVPTARVLAQAYWTNWFGTELGTPGTNITGYSIDTAGVVDGELLVLVACVDNGSDTVWPTPLGPGFTELWQRRWGNDGQTCAIDSKIADHEPAAYTGTYGPGIISGSSLLALVAIDHTAGTDPIEASMMTTGSGAGTNPVATVSPGLATTVADSLVLYVTGSDWQCYEVTDVSFTVPAEFTSLFASSDRGGVMKDWTTFQIDERLVPEAGSTGPIASTETSTGTAACVATPWTAALAIAPR